METNKISTFNASRSVPRVLRAARSAFQNPPPRFRRPRPSRGFTLVELLVVIAIIGILIGLLLPAVQSARESGRRVQCLNNLKQIGIALQSYHIGSQCFPPGSFWFYNDAADCRGSILIRLLPFLEENALYDYFDFTNKVASVDVQMLPDNSNLIQSKSVRVYVCPSDNRPLTLGAAPYQRALHNYAASIGPTVHADSPTCSCPTYDNWNAYAPPPWGGLYGSINFAGPFYRGSVSTRMADCRDGLSSTIYFGEVLPMESLHNQQGWATSNNGQGLTSTLPPINFNTSSTDPAAGCNAYCNWNMELGFKSRHFGGAQFLMGDGSAHMFSETIDHWTYQYLGGKADGHPAQVP